MIEAEELEMMMLDAEERMEKSLDVLKGDVLQIRTGRANPHILDKVLVDYYGAQTPINQVGNISVTEGRCLSTLNKTNLFYNRQRFQSLFILLYEYF